MCRLLCAASDNVIVGGEALVSVAENHNLLQGVRVSALLGLGAQLGEHFFEVVATNARGHEQYFAAYTN